MFRYALAYWLDYGLLFVHNDFQWRFPLAFQVFFGLILLSALRFLPESPRWLCATKQEKRAKDVLNRIVEENREVVESHAQQRLSLEERYEYLDTKIETEFDNIIESLENEKKSGKPTWSEMFDFSGTANIGFRTMLGMGIQAMQQLSGINAVAYYQVEVYEMAGFSNQVALLVAGINGK